MRNVDRAPKPPGGSCLPPCPLLTAAAGATVPLLTEIALFVHSSILL